MAASREQSQFSRKHSNTIQPNFRAPTASLKVGDFKVLHAWVHDVRESPRVIFNHSWWPGAQEGDCLMVSTDDSVGMETGFLTTLRKFEPCPKPQLQISVPRPVAEVFGLRNNSEVTLTKVDRSSYCADHVEFIFQDQYLGRNEMWRLGKYLSGQCIYRDQEISFIGGIVAKIATIWVAGREVSSGYMTTATKAIYRSFSAKITIFIQVCRELWEFSGDGERYNEKIVHSFLPALFDKWMEAGTNHIVTIVLISRVFYDESEIDYAAGPLQKDERGVWYKDFYKVITDLQVIHEWKPTLVSLKNSFWDFQRDILLTHHYHRATLDSAIGTPAQVRLIGRISDAHDGPVLEALNLTLNATDNHFIDRSLNLTGSTTIFISPGAGYFRVPKSLLRMTTRRMMDPGFVCTLVLLTKPPLYQSPVFCFQGTEPTSRPDKDGGDGKFETDRKVDPLLMDPLWGGDDDESKPKRTFWWEPFWVSTTFWDKQTHLPFRQDRFVARARMREIQMLGLLEQDVLSSIEVPFLPEKLNAAVDPTELPTNGSLEKYDADKFDLDTFGISSNHNTNILAGGATSSSVRLEKRGSQRHSVLTRIDSIEESPKLSTHRQLPPVQTKSVSVLTEMVRSASPSQQSVLSVRSEKSTSSKMSASTANSKGLAYRLAPSWLFNPFRSHPSEPQTTNVSALASATSHANNTKRQEVPDKAEKSEGSDKHALSNPIPMPSSKLSATSSTPQIQSMTTRNKVSNRPGWNRALEDDLHREAVRRSPINTPPSDGFMSSKRRSTASLAFSYPSSASYGSLANPTRPHASMSYSQVSLASRWQHIFPRPTYKHEIKWKSILTPACLPLTIEHFPSNAVVESSYDVFSYEFIIDPSEMRSFLVKPPSVKGSADDLRRAWALVVMRGMAAVRLSQGFQFILKSQKRQSEPVGASAFRRTKSFVGEEELDARPVGAAEVLTTTTDPVYLSNATEIHRISYTGEAIQVQRRVRRVIPNPPLHYRCLIWPKLGVGYTEHTTEFKQRGLENYGWNSLDMLVAGYENNFTDSSRYWRTRFIVLPTLEPPHIRESGNDPLSEEEARMSGMEKLAEVFTKLRWQPLDDKTCPVRFLNTTLDPAICVLDDGLVNELDSIHAQGPLKKKMKSERDIGDMSLSAIAKAMREEEAVPIKFHQWHKAEYPDSFIGYDFVSWLVREFRDMPTRAQATEFGNKVQELGLFEHCRGKHGFLDGHYYYRLNGDYAMHSTPKYWFRRPASFKPYPKVPDGRKTKRRLILSQSMVIDIDTNKKSDQAECLLLHHDIIHNPSNVFHFELHWIGTTAKCIEDQIRTLSRHIERYGLKLVEAYVRQISDIRESNPFQSCFPIRLAIAPPVVPDLEKRVPDCTNPRQYFEYALLRKFNFTVDIEAAENYPDAVDVVYSYRRAPYKYSQFVHRSGVAFVQVLGGTQGFLFLMNRLMTPGKLGTYKKTPAAAADELSSEMTAFCSDKSCLKAFYEEEVAALPPVLLAMEEPPPLAL